MRRLLAAFLLSWLGGAVANEAPALLDRVAVDGQGRIYAMSRYWGDKLAIWEKGVWREFPVTPSDTPSGPRYLLALRDGRMASVFWDQISRRTGTVVILDGERIVQRFSFPVSPNFWDHVEMAESSRGEVWLTGSHPEVVVCDLKSGESTSHDLTAFVRDPKKTYWNPVHFTEDAEKTGWLWTAEKTNTKSVKLLPIRVRDGHLEPLKSLPGYTGRVLVGLSIRDDHSLWLATHRDGIFILDLATLTAQPFPTPKEVSQWIAGEILPFGDRWLILTGTGWPDIWEFWDNGWSQRLKDDEVKLYSWNRLTPAHADLESGAIFATEQGLLYVPREGDPIPLDWRHGWILPAPTQLLALGGDRFAAISEDDKLPRWMVTDLQDLLAKRLLADVEEFRPWRGWAVDDEERIFSLREEKATDLSMWDRGVWQKIPLPPELKNQDLPEVQKDAANRIWVFSQDSTQPVGILAADRETWEIHTDYRSALLAHREDLQNFAEDLWALRPIVGPEGQIAFRDHDWKIVFWDGQKWHTGSPADMATFRLDDRPGIPFFNEEGQLCVNSRLTDKTWTLQNDRSWKPGEKLPGIAHIWPGWPKYPVNKTLPDGFQPPDLRNPSVATDSAGITWVTGNDNLYRNYRGRTVEVFDQGAVHPFIGPSPLYTVRRDRGGNVWFQLGARPLIPLNYVLLPTRKTGLFPPSFSADTWGNVTLDRPGQGMVEWRMGSGPWQLLPGGTTGLGFFSSGTHTIEVRLITDRLDVIGPVSQTLTIAIAPKEQIVHFIEMLETGPDARRNAAVTALAQLAPTAIPVLKEHLRKNDSWWLRTALQECECKIADAPLREN